MRIAPPISHHELVQSKVYSSPGQLSYIQIVLTSGYPVLKFITIACFHFSWKIKPLRFKGDLSFTCSHWCWIFFSPVVEVKGPLEKDSHVQAVGGEIQVEPVVGSPSPTAEKYGNLLSGELFGHYRIVLGCRTSCRFSHS
jgi:hypothetical protein